MKHSFTQNLDSLLQVNFTKYFLNDDKHFVEVTKHINVPYCCSKLSAVLGQCYDVNDKMSHSVLCIINDTFRGNCAYISIHLCYNSEMNTQ